MCLDVRSMFIALFGCDTCNRKHLQSHALQNIVSGTACSPEHFTSSAARPVYTQTIADKFMVARPECHTAHNRRTLNSFLLGQQTWLMLVMKLAAQCWDLIHVQPPLRYNYIQQLQLLIKEWAFFHLMVVLRCQMSWCRPELHAHQGVSHQASTMWAGEKICVSECKHMR